MHGGNWALRGADGEVLLLTEQLCTPMIPTACAALAGFCSLRPPVMPRPHCQLPAAGQALRHCCCTGCPCLASLATLDCPQVTTGAPPWIRRVLDSP